MIWDENDSLSFNQEQLINKFSENTGMERSKLVGSPLDENTLADESEFKPTSVDEHAMYWSMAWILVYIVRPTRADMFVLTSRLSSYLHESRASHVVAADSSLRCLKGRKL